MSQSTTTVPKADRIYEFMREYRDEHGYMPVIREIADGLDGMPTSVVAYHLLQLERRGDIERAAGKARAIKLTR